MNAEMKSHPVPETSPQKRWLCNELVHELCKEIPTAKTSDQILLTAHKMYVYLEPRFRKKLIYRDANTFLKAKLKNNKLIYIRFDGIALNNESEPIVVLNHVVRSEEMFKLVTNHFTIRIEIRFNFQTNKFRVHIRAKYHRNEINISDNDAQLECAHLLYFLCLIAPLIQPIHLDILNKPIKRFMRFLNAMDGYIDSIEFTPGQFNSAPIDGSLGKCNMMKIFCSWSSSVPVNAPKLVHWLTTSNNNGQSKKYLKISAIGMTNATQFLDEVKRRFVARLSVSGLLAQFYDCNELTGEILQMRCTCVFDGCVIYTLNRRQNNEFDDIGNNWAESDPHRMTKISLY